MKRELLTSAVLALTLANVQAQAPVASPKLLVTLTIDQLRTDYMEAFSPLYGEGGFKRLMREGRVYRQADFGYDHTDRASAIATLYSGATPSLNGIIASQWFDAGTLHPTDCVSDPNYMGNYTNESSSPVGLVVSTLADELKVATAGKAIIYAVAPTRDAAILSAGHAANGAFWLNETTGKWCSTTYYNDFPWWVSQYNQTTSPDLRIKDMVWEPLYPVSAYTFLPEWRSDAFRYKMDSDRTNRFRRLSTSPLINEEINLLTAEMLEKSNIGDDETTDLLALTYYAGNFNHKSVVECAMEMQDAYVRLDRCLTRLLEMLDKKVGLQHVLLCIAPTGYADPDEADRGTYRIPTGEFYTKRCATLLNMYLMATYGQGQYVEGYYDLQVFLNHKLLEEKQLPLADIQDKAADFLVNFSGVNEVYSAHRLLLGSWSPQVERIRNGFHRKRSGDLLIEVLPGWTVMNDNGQSNRTVRYGQLSTPLIILGPGIKTGIVNTPVDMRRIAPSLCEAIHIRAPNACQAEAIEDLYQ